MDPNAELASHFAEIVPHMPATMLARIMERMAADGKAEAAAYFAELLAARPEHEQAAVSLDRAATLATDGDVAAALAAAEEGTERLRQCLPKQQPRRKAKAKAKRKRRA